MTAQDFQLGVSHETVYGTAVTPSRFFEYMNPGSVAADRGRTEGNGRRPGQRVKRSDRFIPWMRGAAGDFEIEPLSKGFGFWLRHMVGAVSTSAVADSVYTHTGTFGDLYGDSFTAQEGRPYDPSGTVSPFTWTGGKVTSWELTNTTEETLRCTLSCDFQDETTGTALATASYPTAATLLDWSGCLITIGGTTFEASDITVGCDNGLNVDRRYLKRSVLKGEPTEGQREVTWSMTAAFDSLTQRDRVASATATGALADVIAEWRGPVLAGASTYPSLSVRLPAARFDEFSVDGEPLTQSLTGVGLDNGTDSPVILTYKSVDATP